MAQVKIPQPAEDAFKGGALDRKYLGEIVNTINIPMETKGCGKVVYSKEKIVFDLTDVFAKTEGVYGYVIANGELRAAIIPLKFIADFQP